MALNKVEGNVLSSRERKDNVREDKRKKERNEMKRNVEKENEMWEEWGKGGREVERYGGEGKCGRCTGRWDSAPR